MALRFDANGERVDHGSGFAATDFDNFTAIYWIQPFAFSTNNRLLYKGGAGPEIWIGELGPSATIQMAVSRATTGSFARAVSDSVELDVWKFFACADSDGVAPQMFVGDRDTIVTEVTYDTRTTGSGLIDDHSANVLDIGGRSSSNSFCECNIALLWLYNERLTLQQIRAHQFDPRRIQANCLLKCHYGYPVGGGAGGDTQIDYSGNGNHGVLQQSPSLADHAPFPPPFGLFTNHRAGSAAAAPATVLRDLIMSPGLVPFLR